MALKHLFEEDITVSTTAIGITSTDLVDSSGNTLNVVKAIFQHKSGGKIFESAKSTPVAGGSDLKHRQIGDEWEVIGFDDLKNYLMIIGTGESDATINVQGFGIS